MFAVDGTYDVSLLLLLFVEHFSTLCTYTTFPWRHFWLMRLLLSLYLHHNQGLLKTHFARWLPHPSLIPSCRQTATMFTGEVVQQLRFRTSSWPAVIRGSAQQDWLVDNSARRAAKATFIGWQTNHCMSLLCASGGGIGTNINYNDNTSKCWYV